MSRHPIPGQLTLELGNRGRGTMPKFERLNRSPLVHDLATSLTAVAQPGWGGRLHGFETVQQAVSEDWRRATFLDLSGLPGSARLAHELRDSDIHCAHSTLASARYQRAKRQVECSGLITRIAQGPKVRAVTVVNPAWDIPAAALSTLTTDQILNALHHALTKSPAPAGEWFFCQIHGEFDSTTETIQLHVHCLATAAYEARLRAYVKGKQSAKVVYLIKGQDIDNAPRQVSYVVQGIWFNRTSYEQAGKTKRGRRSRIPEPWGSVVLLWLNRQTLTSLQLRLGLGNGWY